MGSLRPSRSNAKIRQGSFSHCLVVGRPKSRKGGLVISFFRGIYSCIFRGYVLNPSGVLELSALRQKPPSKHLQPISVIILAGALVDGIGNLQLLYCRGRAIILT